jgi:hypothetical protein
MKRLLAAALAAISIALLPPAQAVFHTFVVEQLYSNADGSVQFVVLHENSGFNGQDLFAGHALRASGPGGLRTFTFPTNLPSSSTAGKRVLIATSGFAALGLVTPNYVIPNGFLPLTGGTVDFAGVDQLSYAALPTDGVNAFYRSGIAPNLATNFAGQSASVSAPPPPVLSFQGIWWGAPAGSESGWGINLAHQGDTVFLSWFTYDPKGRGWWLVMTAQKTGPNAYQGQLFETSGPAFDAVPFLPGNVVPSLAGTGTLAFSDANNGTFTYTVSKGGSVTQTKTLTRQSFGPLPTCSFGTQPNLALATNFQDLWWAKPAGSESGWGINLNHQGDTIFATWFTYDHDGTPLWLVVTAQKTGLNTYEGDLFQTTGPPFNAVPFNPSLVVPVKVGTAKFTFADGNNATFAYTVKLSDMPAAVSQAKAITREVFTAPGTVCQ